MIKLGLLSASYKTTAIENREKLAIPDDEVKNLIAYLKRQCRLDEVMVLSTCNRVELYFHAKNPIQVMDAVESAFLDYFQLNDVLDFKFKRLTGQNAVRHIFRVTASLEAMIIGEPQITGQVKNFFHLSTEGGGCGFFLNQIMNRSFLTAKRVRNETEIAKFAVSISFAAVELAKKIFYELREKVILIVGAGEMAELAVTHLLKAGCSHLLVTNRTFSRAISLAEKFNGSAVRFEYMANHLETADIIISSTGAKEFIIEQAMIQKCMKKRKHRPMFLIDIAVPRDIDPLINEIGNTYVYDIDDLQSVVDTNLKIREAEAEKAQVVIEEEIVKMEEWLVTLDVVPTIKNFRENVLGLANEELQKGLSQLGDISDRQERAIRSMINGFAYKMLHMPTIMLKQKAKEGTAGFEYLQTINDLFGLKTLNEDTAPKKVINLHDKKN
ncbi:MAG: glutamyl-tRNA reductase [SAR324 cluster bacterium]|nr:glutamyl-tRNA reductase [SAR324 cluster bacterium]